MENEKQNVIEVINKVKIEIDKTIQGCSVSKQTIDSISEVIAKLKSIGKVLKPEQKELEGALETLNTLSKELSDIRFDIVLDRVDDMFNIIKKNLLNGMDLKKSLESNHLKIIWHQNAGEIGSIEVLEDYKPEIKIKVRVYENEEEFDVIDTERIYSIISFINTKFNYKEK